MLEREGTIAVCKTHNTFSGVACFAISIDLPFKLMGKDRKQRISNEHFNNRVFTPASNGEISVIFHASPLNTFKTLI